MAGDGDFLMNGQELATAVQYGADLLVIIVDNGVYGTIRMHQEREYPKRLSGHGASQSRFRGTRPGVTAAGRRRSRRPRTSPRRSIGRSAQKGVRLIHCKTDVEQITNATTISKIREKAKA